MRKHLFLTVLMVLASTVKAQETPSPAKAAAPAQPERSDAVLDAAGALVGKPLFLRCLCAENNLTFEASGTPSEHSNTADWTVAAVNVQKVSRKGAGAVELDGVRVAVSYNSTAHEFQRHPQADDKVRLVLPDNGDPGTFRRTLDAVFANGIDRTLQRSTPDYWQHYFDPKLAWPRDATSGAPVYLPGDSGLVFGSLAPAPGAKPGPPVSAPQVAHKAAAQYTTYAQRDHITGKTLLRFVVDSEGLPHQVSIVTPQGYGLDARAAEAVMKMRFTPAMREGKPVAAVVLLNQDFEIVTAPQ